MSGPEPEQAPTDSALADALSAYEKGDFRTVRHLAEALSHSPDPKTASPAEALLRRTGVDPLQVAVLLACALFFAWAVWRYAS